MRCLISSPTPSLESCLYLFIFFFYEIKNEIIELIIALNYYSNVKGERKTNQHEILVETHFASQIFVLYLYTCNKKGRMGLFI